MQRNAVLYTTEPSLALCNRFRFALRLTDHFDPKQNALEQIARTILLESGKKEHE